MEAITSVDWGGVLNTTASWMPVVVYLFSSWMFFTKTRYIWVIQMGVLEPVWKDVYDPLGDHYKYYGALATHIVFLFCTMMFGFCTTQFAMNLGYPTSLAIFPGVLVRHAASRGGRV